MTQSTCSRTRASGFRVTAWSMVLASFLVAPSLQAQGLRASSGLVPAAAQAAVVRADAPRTADYIVAIVNSEPVTNQEVRTRFQRALSQYGRGDQVPPQNELRQQVLDNLILEKAQLQLAAETGIKIDDAQVDEAERNVARQNRMSVTQLREELKKEGVEAAEFRTSLRQRLTVQRLREREVDGKVRVSEADIERFVLQKMDNPGSDLQLNLAQILIAVPEGATPQQTNQAMTLAQTVATQARNDADFAALARTHSAGAERQAGGAMGLRAADRYPVLFLNATRTLAVGGVAGPVRSPAGFHVLKVLEKRIAGLPEPVITETAVRHILLRSTANMNEAQAIARLAAARERIEKGQADFAALAKEMSHDASAKDGGNLGWVAPGMFVPEFEEVMNELRPQQLSQPTVSRFGVHLIQVLERRQVALGPREQREQLRQLVRESKLEEAYPKWLEEVRTRAYVEFREPPQ